MTEEYKNPILKSENEDQLLLDYLVKVSPLFQQGIPLDSAIGITDKEKFLCYYNGKELNCGELAGKMIPPGGLILKAFQSKKVESGYMPKETYGVPFKASVIPVKGNDGQIIGTINIAINLNNQNKLTEVGETIQSSSEELCATSEEIAASSQMLLNRVIEVQNYTNQIAERIKETNKILTLINKLSGNSRLLGLNAAIEAARAGEYGRGFSVVATEMQKMSSESAKAVTGVKELLDGISDIAKELQNKVNETAEISSSQAAATQEVTASAQQLSECTNEITEVAKII